MKMRVKQVISIVMAGAVLISVGPRPAQAGDEEWATAGKILTGLAVFGALQSLAQPEPVYVEQRTVYVQEPVYVYAPPAPVAYAPAPPPPPAVYAPPAQPYPSAQPNPYAPQASYQPSATVPPPVPAQERPMMVQPQPVVVQP